MGKNEKSGLGRTLVKHHNSMIQQTKEKGRFYKSQNKKVLESVTEVSNIDAVIEQTEPPWNAAMSVEELDANEKQVFLVRRRSLARLEENEKLVLTPFEKNLDIWRQLWRVLERSDLHSCSTHGYSNMTTEDPPNTWKTLEMSNGRDARCKRIRKTLPDEANHWDPLFYRCPDLEEYAKEIDKHKRTLLLVNKADLLPVSIRFSLYSGLLKLLLLN
ncbi:thioredoxin-like 3-1 [Hibiscus syriacus]|uniref:Thioredoxin-like 3-1 n=1 Tax=Hibiscus syriacus TaxID=106335 RepID=A0A6A3D4J7_HIBSY|nr:thioredoxin-like 3-1 [Hibiscus syriacus]